MSANREVLADLQAALLRLIASEDFAGFERELAKVSRQLDESDSEQVQEMLAFVQQALIEMRTRRAHLDRALESVQSIRGYLGPRMTSSGCLSVVG